MFRKNLKKQVGKVAAAIMLAAMGFAMTEPISVEAAENNQVVIYADKGFSGDKYTLTGALEKELEPQIKNKISSLDIGKDMIVTLKDANGNGLMLSSGTYRDLRHWNDKAVSIEITHVPGGQDITWVNADKTKIFKDSDFNGTMQTFPYGIGRMRYSSLGENSISSVRVGSNARLILTGSDQKKLEVWKGNYNYLGDFNDKAVEIVATPFHAASGEVIDQTVGSNFAQDKVTFFSESNAIGESITLGVGEFDAGSFGIIGSNNISSMHVPHGYVVTLYHVTTAPLKTYDPLVYRTFAAGTHNDLGRFDDETTKVSITKLGGIDYTLTEKRLEYMHNWEAQQLAAGNYVMTAYDMENSRNVVLSDEYAKAKSQQSETVTTLFAGSSILTNSSHVDQNLASQQFEFTEENSVTTSITHGFGTSVTGSAEFGVGDANLGISVTASYDYSSTDEKSTTNSITYTVPSQYVNVPAGKAVKVVARLEKVKVKGTVDLYATAQIQDKGTFFGYINKGEHGWGSMPKQSYSLNYTAPVVGEGAYEAEYAANLYIDVVDVTNNQTLQSAQSQVMVIEDRAGNSARVIADEHSFDLTK